MPNQIVFPHPKGPLSGPGTLGGYRITSLFGYRKDPITGQEGTGHSGLDLGTPMRVPVHAVYGGVFGPLPPAISGGGGNWAGIELDDGDYWGVGHCDQFVARAGQHVAAGELIAYTGNTGRSTGPHAHHSWRDGPPGRRYSDPFDLLYEAAASGRFPGAQIITPPPNPFPTEDDMERVILVDYSTGKYYITQGIFKHYITEEEDIALWKFFGAKDGSGQDGKKILDLLAEV